MIGPNVIALLNLLNKENQICREEKNQIRKDISNVALDIDTRLTEISRKKNDINTTLLKEILIAIEAQHNPGSSQQQKVSVVFF